MVERRDAAAAGVGSLRRLRELHLVTDEDDVPRARAHGDDVCETDLPCFVDEEVVQGLTQLRPREEPSCSRDELMPAIDCGAVLGGMLDEVAVEPLIGVVR